MEPVPASPVARKINREAVVLLGWGRAVLLQLAHPLVAAGVSDYSRFRRGTRGYLRRVRSTVGAMIELTFGTPDEAQRIVRRINGIHDQVHGQLDRAVGIFPAGTPYSARDPRLLCWVHATLIESMVVSYELFVDPLSPEEKDRYAVDATWLARELGVEADLLPRDYRGIETHLRSRYDSGEIAVGDNARVLAGALLSPPLGPAAAPLFRVTRLITIGLLPAHVREAYGFTWNAQRERSFRRAVAFIRRTRRLLPAIFREWPAARLAA
ncbi:MAG TPA: oxygenase MpaB family protein [Vicinamibacterales bacterium]|nr:oxygenase MpaB family protein [Vicinamibacterales bacterium]